MTTTTGTTTMMTMRMTKTTSSGWYMRFGTKMHFFDNDTLWSICGGLLASDLDWEVRGTKRGRCKHCVRMTR
jgi:hypothetical protein